MAFWEVNEYCKYIAVELMHDFLYWNVIFLVCVIFLLVN